MLHQQLRRLANAIAEPFTTTRRLRSGIIEMRATYKPKPMRDVPAAQIETLPVCRTHQFLYGRQERARLPGAS